MLLLIDDFRNLPDYDLIARNAIAGKHILQAMKGLITEVHIDHDLSSGFENGYNVIQYALDKKCLPDDVTIVSMNPVGANNIASILLKAGYIGVNGSNRRFKRPMLIAIAERCSTSGGSFTSVNCPYCSAFNTLGGSPKKHICNKCSKTFIIREV